MVERKPLCLVMETPVTWNQGTYALDSNAVLLTGVSVSIRIGGLWCDTSALWASLLYHTAVLSASLLVGDLAPAT